MNFGWLTTLIHENVHAQGDHSDAHSTRFYNKTVPILVSVVLQEVRYITSGCLGNNEKIAFGKVPQTEKDYILQVVKSTKPKIIRISTKP